VDGLLLAFNSWVLVLWFLHVDENLLFFAFSSKVYGCKTWMSNEKEAHSLRRPDDLRTGSFLLSPVGNWCFGFCMWMKPTFLCTLFFTAYGCKIMDVH
jgi:hypothetical protein